MAEKKGKTHSTCDDVMITSDDIKQWEEAGSIITSSSPQLSLVDLKEADQSEKSIRKL